MTSDLVVKGYVLSMDSGAHTDILPIYIGTNQPDVHHHQVGNLTTGLSYRFSVQAINQNGFS